MTAALQGAGVELVSEGLIALRQIALSAGAGSSLAALPGGFATKRKGAGLEVADMREYVAGDDVRYIDPSTTARTGRLHVRSFQEERDRVCLLVADFRPSMFWGLTRAFRSVVAAEVLAMIGWTLVERGGRVGLLALTPDAPVVVPPRGRARGMLDVIGGLVEAHRRALDLLMAGQGGEPDLAQGLSRAERLVPPGAEIAIASGFDYTGDLRDRLDALSRRRDPRLLLITDAEGAVLPKGRYPVRLADGRHIRVHLAPSNAPGLHRTIAGREALVVNAGDSVEETAQRLSLIRSEVPP